ncbi:uncharacterized protein LOC126669688 [Mercurialis annua]|uniref:uncharacterized protein LOC126669688 n=1 Tax=Mercurialis annua TaxID=3986 RepID=UPI002160A2E7|nr:uncharacterized protein LOC126669688 [Mercurialis annua]XP_050219178.1 uncharacterized protein LOC126669688 [Mercurialis annua]XP_050219179.1 uncharacterized protein LOC126669688 [Mercurialis annua]
MRVPICWKKLDKSDKQKAHARLDMRLSILNRQDEDVTRRIDDILKRRSKDCRYKWHQHFLKFDSVDDAIINKPRSCRDDDDWKNLCIYWSNPTVQERCAKNSYNRSMLKILHNQGSMAFVAVRHEIEQNELNGEECDRIELFKRTHYSTGKGWTTIEAEKKYDEMQALLDESSTSIDAMITTDEICDKVLGVRSGYIKGLGYGPKPKRTYTSNSRIQELEESLKASQTECNELKNFYIDLKAQVEQQASWIESLIAAGFRPPPPKQ